MPEAATGSTAMRASGAGQSGWRMRAAMRAVFGAVFGAVLGAFVLLLAAGFAVAQSQTQAPAPKAAEPDVAVALVLAVDTSGSVSMGRFELQKEGYAAAFRNPQVLNAIRSLATQSIAVTMMQWTGP